MKTPSAGDYEVLQADCHKLAEVVEKRGEVIAALDRQVAAIERVIAA